MTESQDKSKLIRMVLVIFFISIPIIAGIFFFRGTLICCSVPTVSSLTDSQLRDQIGKYSSENSNITIYPGTRFVQVKQTIRDGIGFGIKNLKEETENFSYIVTASDVSNCGISKETVEGWIVSGREEEGLSIVSGDFIVKRVLFKIPVGSPLCTIRFRIDVNADDASYAVDFFDVGIKAK